MGFPHDKEPTKSPTNPDKKPGGHHPPPSSSELLSSAKIVAGALRQDPNQKHDNKEVAAAAENILHAASHYGKLDEKGGAMGKMVEQAETYLHKYHSGGGAPTGAAETHHESKPHKEEGHSSGGHSGGYGEYIKMAEGLLNKNKHSGEGGEGAGSGSGGHSGGSKYGDYAKMAGDFLKK